MTLQMKLFDWDIGLTTRPRPARMFHPRSLAPAESGDGGCFDYGKAQLLFLGRKGYGPLRVAWDTNILIDWATYGHLLLEDAELPDVLEPTYADELADLAVLMNLPWMTRDIRIYPLRTQLVDLKRERAHGSRSERARQLDRIAEALWHALPEEEYPSDAELEPGHEWAVPSLSPSMDRQLIEEAIVSGCHVFLCRDRKILSRSLETEALGLRMLSPVGLVDALAESGELEKTFGADGLVCDNHKWQHLWEVTDANPDHG